MARFWAGQNAGRTIGAMIAAVAVMIGLSIGPAGAQSTADVVAALDAEGRYLERSESGLDAAIDRANGNGIAFVLLDQGGDGDDMDLLADRYLVGLAEAGSRYQTVLVVSSGGVGARSDVYDDEGAILDAIDNSLDQFRLRESGQGLDTFTDSLTGGSTTSGQADSGGSDSGGPGFGTILLGIALVGLVFFGFRSFSNNRKRKKQIELDMEEDRAEIREQLKNNADRVISLGDRVIAKGDQDLIARYEEASQMYQDVSQRIDGATTPAEVDELDDRIDHAEWQFEVIEAQLGGLPIPPSPEEKDAQREARERAEAEAAQPPPASPADDRSVATSPRTGRSYPRTSGSRRRGGGLSDILGGGGRGGGLGGGLGGILGSIVLGGGLGGRSRRSQRRSGGYSRPRSRSAGSTMGGPGGGVLRRAGGSRSTSRPNTRSNTRSRSRKSSGGGRSFGRSKGGGRSFR